MGIRRWGFVVLLLLMTLACGSDSFLNRLSADLAQYPEYSIILQDMRSEGIFFHDYFHRYRLLYLQKQNPSNDNATFEQKLTDWIKVDEKTYEKYQDALGMVILAKKADGSIEKVPQPVGYQYVGDPRFGQWIKDEQGNQFWEWFGKYMLLAQVLDVAEDVVEGALKTHHYHRIGYNDWKDYRTASAKGISYFGKKDKEGKPEFGTTGSITQKTNVGFFERQKARMEQRKTSFADKVKSRTGRTKVSSARTRSSISSSSGK